MRTRNKNKPDTSALRQLGLDAVLSRRELEQLARDTDAIDVPAGEQLSRSGIPARELIGILDGYVDVFDEYGNRRIAGPGARIGGLEVLDGRCQDVTVVARSACRLVVIFGPALRRVQPSGAVAAWLGGAVAVTGEPALVG
jgi:CRP-like cAMP-binding protein